MEDSGRWQPRCDGMERLMGAGMRPLNNTARGPYLGVTCESGPSAPLALFAGHKARSLVPSIADTSALSAALQPLRAAHNRQSRALRYVTLGS